MSKLASMVFIIFISSNYTSAEGINLSKQQVSDLYHSPGTIISCTSGIQPEQIKLANIFLLNNGTKIIEMTESMKTGKTTYSLLKNSKENVFEPYVKVLDIVGSSYKSLQIQSNSDLGDGHLQMNLFSRSSRSPRSPRSLSATTFFNCVRND